MWQKALTFFSIAFSFYSKNVCVSTEYILGMLKTKCYSIVHMNYALVDPKGRLFSGTLDNRLFCAAAANNTIHRYSNRKGLTAIFDTLKTTNELAIM